MITSLLSRFIAFSAAIAASLSFTAVGRFLACCQQQSETNARLNTFAQFVAFFLSRWCIAGGGTVRFFKVIIQGNNDRQTGCLNRITGVGS